MTQVRKTRYKISNKPPALKEVFQALRKGVKKLGFIPTKRATVGVIKSVREYSYHVHADELLRFLLNERILVQRPNSRPFFLDERRADELLNAIDAGGWVRPLKLTHDEQVDRIIASAEKASDESGRNGRDIEQLDWEPKVHEPQSDELALTPEVVDGTRQDVDQENSASDPAPHTAVTAAPTPNASVEIYADDELPILEDGELVELLLLTEKRIHALQRQVNSINAILLKRKQEKVQELEAEARKLETESQRKLNEAARLRQEIEAASIP